MDKENTHPNLLHLAKHKKSFNQWIKLSSDPKISSFKTNEQEWKKKIIAPSQK
jgi:hypothetical protein